MVLKHGDLSLTFKFSSGSGDKKHQQIDHHPSNSTFVIAWKITNCKSSPCQIINTDLTLIVQLKNEAELHLVILCNTRYNNWG